MKKLKYVFAAIAVFLLIIMGNLYLQWCQNDLSLDLALKFAFSWHTAKFFLGSLVLLAVYGVFAAIAGSLLFGGLFYSVAIGLLGFADYQKMTARQEPIYPDDLKMLGQLGVLKDMVGWPLFIFALFVLLLALLALGYSIYRSRKLAPKKQIFRGIIFLLSVFFLLYASHFNSNDNLLRKAYNKTALWIPYSQKMNYYNVGFVGGFLYNLRVEAMTKPQDYSAEKVASVVKKYQGDAETDSKEKPNIIYVMSESFSDPAHLKGIQYTGQPLADYYAVANNTYSGKMLSQNYGGGTANIEFEALTSFSMELLNAQMTTPYTLLVPKLKSLPSLVSLTKEQGYDTTAIHPYDTSMYKRKDVYNILGFDRFLDQDTMKYRDKIENNPYISDESAYDEILDLLKANKKPQFVHLVTMQTHMPYGDKYNNISYNVTADDNANTNAIANYLQDVAYSSAALQHFTEAVKQLPRRTLIVFWGDHLPGIYSDAIQKANSGTTLHETQFLMFDSAGKLANSQQHDAITSPFYFAPNLFSQAGLKLSPYYEMLLQLAHTLPAFEKNMYLNQGTWQKNLTLTGAAKTTYEDYRLIQYDILAGKQYSLKTDFFK
ncbi:LTA synthase family protein [Enterococcus canintestini]|uniref:Sulfatase N-terminal domain-containing protein n=1 Tax=Enterococcus canintestini TaxID=317010 RepID=A0A267HP17_9ENTE|nr:LTA synthase family protein [Enterococcus canintestini]PAB00119.1 hypothetical protein AKL21_11225 [Enterococcus canintestini]